METIVLIALFLYYFVFFGILLFQGMQIKYLKAKIAVLEGTLNFYQNKPKLKDPEYHI